MSVLIFADNSNGRIAKAAYEAVSYGSKIAGQLGTHAVAVTYGNVENAAELGAYGASRVLVCGAATNSDAQKLTRLVVNAAGDEDADVIIFSQDHTGKAVAPRVAARLSAGLVGGAVDHPNTEGGFTVRKAVFSGKAFATYKVNSDKKVIALLPNSVGVENTGGTAEVVDYSTDLGDSRVTVKEVKAKGTGGILLTEADTIVSAGRGLKGPENWGMIEELAAEMGAATACSRPVADIGWRPHHEHVGQTGIAVRPNLYIAIGISGAIQHLAGVNGSKVMVVINTDSEAPFFKAADYGIVGDAFHVVPKLIEAYRNFKAASN